MSKFESMDCKRNLVLVVLLVTIMVFSQNPIIPNQGLNEPHFVFLIIKSHFCQKITKSLS